MIVKKARLLGFCMGVRRAVELAVKETQQAGESGFPVYTLGSLIHNPKVLEDLKNRGIKSIDGPPRTPDCCVIIRAHGVTPAAESELRGTGCRVIDATCPKVKASQLKTQEMLRAGYFLFLAGEADHSEIEGIMGYAIKAGKEGSISCAVVSSGKEAEESAASLCGKNSGVKTALLAQTTISEEEYQSIGEKIKKYFPNLEIIDTICRATKERQVALRELLCETDAVIIAGGKESANTRRLLAIAKESGKPCAIIEKAEEVPKDFFNYKTIGLCSGASTPDSAIDDIENALVKTHLA